MFKNQSFYEGLVSLIPQILPLIHPALKAKYIPAEISKYPNLSYKANGFPSISHYPSKPDIGNLFRDAFNGQKSSIDLKEFEAYNQLLTNLLHNPQFTSYYANRNLRCRIRVET